MLARLEQIAHLLRRSAVVAAIVTIAGAHARLALAQGGGPIGGTGVARQRERTDEREALERMHRQEGEAILALADAAMYGKPVRSDFALRWQNAFLKAQRGTFVPFTLSLDASRLSRPSALVYVRAARRAVGALKKKGDSREGPEYPVDAIFPVELDRSGRETARISRGFTVQPGDYDVLVVMRERVEPGASRPQPKVAVIRQVLSVPDFWSDELTTSSVMLADRLEVLSTPVAADEIAERPYAIGRNEITPAEDGQFGRDEELIVVFLVYNPTVTAERHFDIKVEYHFFRKVDAGRSQPEPAAGPHPPARAGERYFNRTDPQRFTPALMGAGFDPRSGEPVMAGQVVPLAGFQEGEYRLDVQISDLLSGKSISREVSFSVDGGRYATPR